MGLWLNINVNYIAIKEDLKMEKKMSRKIKRAIVNQGLKSPLMIGP